ncbi:MAG: tetratricopeptide repeat protein [Archangium sp.]|nr:tetratricopeptide repeat protein [Archangium sp.]
MLPTRTHFTETQPASNTAQRSNKPLVLVIDPDESTRSVLEVALSRDGFDVWSASGSAEGMLLLTGHLPDVIVLESDLGGDDGFAFVAQVRGDERTAKLPVVLLARAEDQNVEAMADVVGVDDFLQKPAFARDVAAMVRLELARRAAKSPTSPLKFDTHVLPPEQLLRALLSCPRSGRLLLVNGRAEIRFRAGKIIDARFDDRGADIDTVVRSLALTAGDYGLVLEPVNGFAELQCSLREMVELVLPRLQRWGRVLQRSLPLDARLTLDFPRLAGAFKAMPDEVNKIVRLFDGFRDVERVLIDSEINETLTLEVATRLYLMGVLVPAKDQAEELEQLRAMPRLFEPRAAEAEELMQQLFAGTAEIRADEGTPGEDADWFALSNAGTGLDVADPNGGWTTAPVPTDLAEGLSPELARQLDAFQTPMVVEAKQQPAEEKTVQTFAHRDHAAAASETAIEVALMQAADGTVVNEEDDVDENAILHASDESTTADLSAGGIEQIEADLNGELKRFDRFAVPTEIDHAEEAHRLSARGAQARIETPWMTPISSADGSAGAIVDPSAVTDRSLTPKMVPAVEAAPTVEVAPAARAEASFFNEDAFMDEGAVAAEPAPTADDELLAPKKNDRRLWPFVVAALAIGALGLLIDAMSAPKAEELPDVVVAPSMIVEPPANLPDIEEPEFYGDDVLAAPVAIDVSENLLEAEKLAAQGQYKKAISVLEQAVSDDPASVNAWNLMAIVKYDAVELAGAREAVAKVLELDPKNARVQILIASMHFDANEKDQGRAALEKYLELEPNGPHAEEAQALLKR